MLNENLHWGLVGERAILLVEPEMCWVQMDNERRGASAVFLQDVAIGSNWANVNGIFLHA